MIKCRCINANLLKGGQFYMNKKIKELLIIFLIMLILNELLTLLIPYGFVWQIQLFILGRTLVSTAIVYVLYIVIKNYWQENKN